MRAIARVRACACVRACVLSSTPVVVGLAPLLPRAALASRRSCLAPLLHRAALRSCIAPLFALVSRARIRFTIPGSKAAKVQKQPRPPCRRFARSCTLTPPPPLPPPSPPPSGRKRAPHLFHVGKTGPSPAGQTGPIRAGAMGPPHAGKTGPLRAGEAALLRAGRIACRPPRAGEADPAHMPGRLEGAFLLLWAPPSLLLLSLL